jgi:hypothetical protein
MDFLDKLLILAPIEFTCYVEMVTVVHTRNTRLYVKQRTALIMLHKDRSIMYGRHDDIDVAMFFRPWN